MSAPAANLDQIEDVETAIEEYARALFTSLEITALTRLNAPEEFQQATPRVEIKCRAGGHTGRRDVCPDGHVRYSAWSFDLAIQAVTLSQNGEEANQTHRQFRARIRGQCSSLAQNSWADTVNFPFHLIAEALRETGGSDSTVRDGCEYSTLGFHGIVMVRPGAWPLN